MCHLQVVAWPITQLGCELAERICSKHARGIFAHVLTTPCMLCEPRPPCISPLNDSVNLLLATWHSRLGSVVCVNKCAKPNASQDPTHPPFRPCSNVNLDHTCFAYHGEHCCPIFDAVSGSVRHQKLLACALQSPGAAGSIAASPILEISGGC